MSQKSKRQSALERREKLNPLPLGVPPSYKPDLLWLPTEDHRPLIKRIRAKIWLFVHNNSYLWSPKHLIYKYKQRRHRSRHGWATGDMMSLDSVFARIIAESIDYYKDNHFTYPAMLTPESYEEILKKIADGFKHYNDVFADFKNCNCCYGECLGPECPMIKEAKELFMQWFEYMGD